MQKNKLIIALALIALVLPSANLKAEEGTGSSNTEAEVETNIELRRNGEFERDRPMLPPPRPLNKDRSVEKEDDRAVRSGIKGKMVSDDIDDDKGGLRIKQESRLRTNLKENRGENLSEEEKVEMKAKFEARKSELKLKLEERKGELKIKLEEKSKERVKNILSNMFKMLTNQLERLSKADERIGEKIASLKEKGLDVSAASAQYVVAQTALAKAKVDVEATSSLSTEQADTETSKETLRALVKTATDSIKSAGSEYRKIFPLMPKETLKAEVETSTSTSSSATE